MVKACCPEQGLLSRHWPVVTIENESIGHQFFGILVLPTNLPTRVPPSLPLHAALMVPVTWIPPGYEYEYGG